VHRSPIRAWGFVNVSAVRCGPHQKHSAVGRDGRAIEDGVNPREAVVELKGSVAAQDLF
jgi:hypothetical protein